jgi:hypothetical protein
MATDLLSREMVSYWQVALSLDPPISKAYASLLMSTLLGKVTSPSAKPLILEDQFVSLSLASFLRSVRLGRPYKEHKVPAGIARKVIEARKAPPLRQGGDIRWVPEQVKRPNPLRKMMMISRWVTAKRTNRRSPRKDNYGRPIWVPEPRPSCIPS